MFIIEYDDCLIKEDKNTTWDKLPNDKPIRTVLLANKNIIVGLTDMDKYWFSNQAIAAVGKQGKLIAQILGGEKDGQTIEFLQSVEDGKAAMHFFNKFNITADHKPGRKINGSAQKRDNIVTRLFRRFK